MSGRSAADITARSRTIVDNELLAERFAQRIGDGTGRNVSGAAGRERHDHGDGPGRPCLRLDALAGCERSDEAE
jgi:hypothetical protein